MILKTRGNKNPYGLKDKYGRAYSTKETKEYFQSLNMTQEELENINRRIKEGYQFYDDRIMVYDENGIPVNLLEEYRFYQDMLSSYKENNQHNVNSKINLKKNWNIKFIKSGILC